MSPHSRHRKRLARSRRRGFSLAECAFSLLLVAVVIVGGLRAISVTHRTRTEAQNRRVSTELALRLLDEIRQCDYVDANSPVLLGIELDELLTSNRTNFDDVDDYNSYSESTLIDKSGATVPGATGYTRSCTVALVDPNNPTATVGSDQGVKRIRVTVTGPDGKTVTLTGLRTSKGMGEQRPTAPSTYVTWAGASITVGTQTPLSTGTNLSNGAQ